MTLEAGKYTKSKDNHTMKFGQFIECNMSNSFFKITQQVRQGS